MMGIVVVIVVAVRVLCELEGLTWLSVGGAPVVRALRVGAFVPREFLLRLALAAPVYMTCVSKHALL